MQKDEEIYHLSPEELEAANEGIWQIENGFFFSNEEANRRFDEVLNKLEIRYPMNDPKQ